MARGHRHPGWCRLHPGHCAPVALPGEEEAMCACVCPCHARTPPACHGPRPRWGQGPARTSCPRHRPCCGSLRGARAPGSPPAPSEPRLACWPQALPQTLHRCAHTHAHTLTRGGQGPPAPASPLPVLGRCGLRGAGAGPRREVGPTRRTSDMRAQSCTQTHTDMPQVCVCSYTHGRAQTERP